MQIADISMLEKALLNSLEYVLELERWLSG